MEAFKFTREVLQELGLSENRLRYLIRRGDVHPTRAPTGDYVWYGESIAQLKSAMGRIHSPSRDTGEVATH